MTETGDSGLPRRKNPAEVRSIFGQNLRLLVKQKASVSAVCRELGINRTQFNRYLSGATYPRPDVLAVICDYFGVDARILLEPVDIVNQSAAFPEMEAEKRLIENIHETGILTVDPRSFSDGFYLFYLLPESATDVVAVILQRVTRGGDGMTTAQFNLPLSMAERLGVPNTKRRVSSLVMQHSSGVAFFSLVPDAGLIVTVYVDVGFLATQRFFKGRFMASSDSGVMARVGRSCAFERLGNTKAAAFAARPRLGFKFLEDVPVPVRNLMSGGDPDQHTAAPASYLKSRHG